MMKLDKILLILTMLLTSCTGNAAVLNLSWDSSISTNINGYKLYQDGVLIATVPKTVTKLRVSKLKNNKTYSFYATAYNLQQESTKSNTLTVTTNKFLR